MGNRRSSSLSGKNLSFLRLILSGNLSSSFIKTNVRKNESKMYYVCSKLKYPHNMAKSFLKSHFISGGIYGEKMKMNCDFIKTLALLSKVKRANVPKGPSLYYVRVFLSFSRPPTYPCKE